MTALAKSRDITDPLGTVVPWDIGNDKLPVAIDARPFWFSASYPNTWPMLRDTYSDSDPDA